MAKRITTDKKSRKSKLPAKAAQPVGREGTARRTTQVKPSRSRSTGSLRSPESDRMPGFTLTPVGSGVRNKLPVVGMVASAGGLDAYTKFFKAMPADSGMAFVLIPHLDPTRESMMVPLLARHTDMPVAEAAEGARIEANHVYIIPPNKYLELHQGVLHLRGPVERGGYEIAIDAFLRSLADDQQEQAIGVILSGTGAHGTLGVKAIKGGGGMVMVQDPKSAEQPQMPQSAIETDLADYVLPPQKMPSALLQYVRHFLRPGAPVPAEVPDDLTQVLTLLRAGVKYDFRAYRKRMLLRRIERRIGLNHLDDLSAYLELLRRSPDELKRLAKDLLITVTSFFRDPEMFQLIETQVIPELLRHKAPDAPVRVWVPACATGEEAYSFAMLLIESIAATGKSCPLQVFATDIEPEAIETARQGVYTGSLLADLGPRRLKQFFTKIDEHHYQVNKSLRDVVLFAQQNLLTDAPFSKLDMVSCRNVLIYLEPEIQHKILQLLHFALNDGGYLVLGPSESIGRHIEIYQAVSKKWRIYRRTGIVQRERVEFPIQAGAGRGEVHPPPLAPLRAHPVSLAELTRDLLLEDFGPATVLIRRNYEVLHFQGPTERYLEQPSGPPTQDLMLLARDGLRVRLRATIHKALQEDRRVSLSGARIKRNGHYVTVRVTARPLHVPRAIEGLVLVSFEDEGGAPRTKSRGATAAEELVTHQLEHELKSTREDLQNTIEELESSNEELKASNEEVMSMNEELQSTNEELETSKEELQSLNEELATVNSQLQEKVEELESANNDMANLLTSTDIATLFLAADHTIQRFTAPTTRLYKLIPSDVGRPIDDISARVDDPALPDDVDSVLQTLTPRERELRCEDGHWYLRRINPYRTSDKRIEGVVVVYIEVSALKRAEEELRLVTGQLEARVEIRTAQLEAERNFMNSVLDSMLETVVTIDEQGVIQSMNRAGEKMFGYSANEIIGRNVSTLMPEPYRSEHDGYIQRYLRSGEPHIIGKGRDLPVQRRDGSTFQSWLTVTEVVQDGRHVFAGMLHDLTEQRRAEKEATEHREELTHLHRLYTAGEFAAVMAHELSQPLAAIAGYSEASLQRLRRGEIEPDSLTGELERIALQAQRAGQVIRDLRKFLTRDEHRKRETVELNALVHTVLDLLIPEARANGVRLEFKPAAAPLTVMVSDVQIEHVLVNLVQNAIEAIRGAGKSGGTITLRIAAEPGGMAHLSVQDDGPGFSGEGIPEGLFERFYTTKPDGLGMGLAICRAIVEAYNGKIWAECPAEGGTLFHFILPQQA